MNSKNVTASFLDILGYDHSIHHRIVVDEKTNRESTHRGRAWLNEKNMQNEVQSLSKSILISENPVSILKNPVLNEGKIQPERKH